MLCVAQSIRAEESEIRALSLQSQHADAARAPRVAHAIAEAHESRPFDVLLSPLGLSAAAKTVHQKHALSPPAFEDVPQPLPAPVIAPVLSAPPLRAAAVAPHFCRRVTLVPSLRSSIVDAAR